MVRGADLAGRAAGGGVRGVQLEALHDAQQLVQVVVGGRLARLHAQHVRAGHRVPARRGRAGHLAAAGQLQLHGAGAGVAGRRLLLVHLGAHRHRGLKLTGRGGAGAGQINGRCQSRDGVNVLLIARPLTTSSPNIAPFYTLGHGDQINYDTGTLLLCTMPLCHAVTCVTRDLWLVCDHCYLQHWSRFLLCRCN